MEADIRSSGLFDVKFYISKYQVGAADAIGHYLLHGVDEGLDPNPYFSTQWYVSAYPDVAATGVNPLWHYIKFGWREGRRPCQMFDAQRYRDLTGRPVNPDLCPLKDFLAYLRENDHPSNADSPAQLLLRKLGEDGFDGNFYGKYYQDCEHLSERELISHYLLTGRPEGRYGNVRIAIAALEALYGDLPKDFDEKAYLDHYESVARGYPFEGGGIVHYLQFGRAEGLRTRYVETYDAHRLHLMMNRIYDMPEVVVDAKAPERINVLVPAFDFKSMSAGFFGVFQVARFISSCGFRVRLVMFDNFYYNEAEFREKLAGYPGMQNLFDELEVLYIGERKAPLTVSPRDNCVATVWYSAHFARKIMARIGDRPFLYLIQDYETNFYPGSAQYSAAEETYSFNFNALFSSQSLQDTFVTKGIGVFGKNAPQHIYFNNACARHLPTRQAFLKRSVSTRKLAFYCRPGVSRNMFELGALALCEAYRRGVFKRRKWEFYGIGLGEVTIQIAPDVSLLQMPRMNLADYQRAIGEFDLGLCLMASPHPSLLPFDLGGSGSMVVTNNFGVKNQAYFDGLCGNVISRDPTLEDIISGITEAVGRLSDSATRYANAAAMIFPDSWEQTFQPRHMRFIRQVFGKASKPKGITQAPAKAVKRKITLSKKALVANPLPVVTPVTAEKVQAHG